MRKGGSYPPFQLQYELFLLSLRWFLFLSFRCLLFLRYLLLSLCWFLFLRRLSLLSLYGLLFLCFCFLLS